MPPRIAANEPGEPNVDYGVNEGPGMSRAELEAEVRRLEQLARAMDSLFVLPGTSFRVGLDGVIGLIPGIGDAAGAAISLYLVYAAHRIGAPRTLIARMLANVGIDMLAGSVPLVGDIFDFAWKANRRNMDLLRRHLRERGL